MSDDSSRLTRRTALKGLGGAAGAALVGGAGLSAFMGSGVAVSKFKVQGDDSTFETNDGQVSAVVVDPTGTITWDGLDHNASNAVVTLKAKNGNGEYVKAGEQTLSLDAKGRKSGSADFDLTPIDLTTLDGLDDAYFSAGEDGDTQQRTVDLEISVTVNTDDEDYTVSDSKTATMNTDVLNEPASTGGDATADTYDAYAGPIYDKNDEQTGEDAYLYIRYGSDSIIMEMDLRNYLDDISDGAPKNAAIGIDVDENNIGDYQFGWLPEIDGPAEFAVKEGSETGWSEWIDASTHDAVTSASMNDGIVQFELDRSVLGIEPGDTYLTGYFASAGGEEEYVAVSAEPGKFWSSENNFTASTYYLQVVAE